MQHLLVRAETMDGLDQVRLEAHARPRAGNGPGRLTLGNSLAGLQLLMMNVRVGAVSRLGWAMLQCPSA